MPYAIYRKVTDNLVAFPFEDQKEVDKWLKENLPCLHREVELRPMTDELTRFCAESGLEPHYNQGA